MLIIESKEELKAAEKAKEKEFVILGSLAEDFKKASKIKKLKKRTVFVLAGAVGAGAAATPFTLGTSAVASFGVLGSTALAAGISTKVIIAAISMGGILYASSIFKKYDFVEIEIGGKNGVRVTSKNN